MNLFNEKDTVEKPTIDFFQRELGYRYIPSEEFTSLRESESQYIIEPLFLAAVQKINDVDEETARRVLTKLKEVDTNWDFLEKMKFGVQVVNQETGQNETIYIVDYKNHENNDFAFTDQFYFAGDVCNGIPDIAVIVNGMVVSLIELKSPMVSFERGG